MEQVARRVKCNPGHNCIEHMTDIQPALYNLALPFIGIIHASRRFSVAYTKAIIYTRILICVRELSVNVIKLFSAYTVDAVRI